MMKYVILGMIVGVLTGMSVVALAIVFVYVAAIMGAFQP